MALRLDPLAGVNLLIAVGSIDGIAGAIACARYIQKKEGICPEVIFTQAFQVNKIEMSNWGEKRQVGLIDLAVNNDSRSSGSQLTEDFIKRICKLGHEIVFIADEHGKAPWEAVLVKCGVDLGQLRIRPEDREAFSSSSAILKNALGNLASLDPMIEELLDAGDKGDQMDFSTRLGKIFNDTVKSNIGDNKRREALFKCFTASSEPNEEITIYMKEYAIIQSNGEKILSTTRKHVANGIVSYDASIGPHDPTAIFMGAYLQNPGSYFVVLMHTPTFVGGTRDPKGTSIATNAQGINILELLKNAGIAASGMPQKVNIKKEDTPKALAVINNHT